MEQLFLCPISKEEFYKEIGNIVDEKFRNLIGKTYNQNPTSEDKYLTRQEACQILRISLPTLDSYTKKGIIKKYRIGRRVLFKKTEIDSLFEEVNSSKYKKKNSSI
jgi:DNA binding domain, excisionase family